MKLITLCAFVVAVSSCTAVYMMKHPNLESVKSIRSSWMSEEEKDGAIKRVVSLGCDKVFRAAFIPGTSVVPTGIMDDMTEQSDAYQYLSDVAIIHGDKGYHGKYICTYYKDGKPPVLNVSLDGGVKEILKK